MSTFFRVEDHRRALPLHGSSSPRFEKLHGQRHFLHRAVRDAQAVGARAALRRDDFVDLGADEMNPGPVFYGDAGGDFTGG
jgi:hypothetical protein